MKNKQPIKFYSYSIAFFGTLLLLLGCKDKVEEKESIRPVYYEKISSNNGSNQFTIPGIVSYDKESNLSFKVGGVITKINTVIGQKVDKGSILATLDGTDYYVSLTQAKASNETAKANVLNANVQLTNAKSNYLRTEKLYVKNHTSLSEFENAKAQFENAQGGLKAAQSQERAARAIAQAAQNQLSYTRLLAPINGIVSQIFIEENEMIGVGMPTMVIASNNVFEVNASVPESWINQLKVGQEVSIKIGALKKELKGILKEISPNAPANTGYPVKIAFNESTPELKSGMSVSVQIPNLKGSKASKTIIVDVDAVSKDESGFFVYTLSPNENGNYISKLRNVDVGNITNKGYIITKGLKSDELIATAGIRFLYEGKIVTLKEPDFK
jgi:RND family efflux transporter MFP subunit